jgi:hypothetical protein
MVRTAIIGPVGTIRIHPVIEASARLLVLKIRRWRFRAGKQSTLILIKAFAAKGFRSPTPVWRSPDEFGRLDRAPRPSPIRLVAARSIGSK